MLDFVTLLLLKAQHDELKKNIVILRHLLLLKAQHDELKKKLNGAKKSIEESEANLALAVAEAKQRLHASLEMKDDELAESRETLRLTELKNLELIEQLEQLKLSGLCHILD